MDDTARELLRTTCTQHKQTNWMRVLLARYVSEPPANVGRDPQGGKRDSPQGRHPAPPRPPRACEGGKGRKRVSE